MMTRFHRAAKAIAEGGVMADEFARLYSRRASWNRFFRLARALWAIYRLPGYLDAERWRLAKPPGGMNYRDARVAKRQFIAALWKACNMKTFIDEWEEKYGHRSDIG